MQLYYDIVIATRNRPDILRVSIPLMLKQSRPPRRLIVVDSSDDAEAVPAAIGPILGPSGIPWKILRSLPGTTRQRNVGLAQVESPIVMYPDDDSLWLPGVAEEIMRVYERDEAGVIGAVCAAESLVPPEGVLAVAQQVYQVSLTDKLKLSVGNYRNRMEHALFPDPFIVHGRSRWSARSAPAWLKEQNTVLVEYMTGFRMSFRTEIIRRSGFDEVFRRYGLFEDTEASFQVMKTHLVVGARNAQVYHYRAPGRRTDGVMGGARQVLDRAYIICRHSEPGSRARRLLARYASYKLLLYASACHSRFGRQRFLGAWRAAKRLNTLLAASMDSLPQVYLDQLAVCTR